MLSVNNINQYYGGSHILRDVSLGATQGKVTVVLGRSEERRVGKECA